MRIALLGDIAPFGRYCLNRNKNVLEQFAPLKNYLSSFDIVIGNLEAPFALDERPIGGKSATVKAHPDNVSLLLELGITHVTLANNHIGDFGRGAYERTKALLDNAGIGWFGTEGKQIHVTQDGEKIAMLGYCSYNTNPSPVDTGSATGLNYLDAIEVSNAIKSNASRGFISILAAHSGQEHVHMPSSEDVAFARALARVSDYVYFGHHPHVVQGHEAPGGSALFYSLGNLVFDDVYTPRDRVNPLIRLSEANKTGIIGNVQIEKGRIVGSGVTPTYLALDRVLIGEEVSEFDMQTYNSLLRDAGTPEYDRHRAKVIEEYFNTRRELRDLKWFLKRLNLNSVGIIVKARKNAKLHRELFSSRLASLENQT